MTGTGRLPPFSKSLYRAGLQGMLAAAFNPSHFGLQPFQQFIPHDLNIVGCLDRFWTDYPSRRGRSPVSAQCRHRRPGSSMMTDSPSRRVSTTAPVPPYIGVSTTHNKVGPARCAGLASSSGNPGSEETGANDLNEVMRVLAHPGIPLIEGAALVVLGI